MRRTASASRTRILERGPRTYVWFSIEKEEVGGGVLGAGARQRCSELKTGLRRLDTCPGTVPRHSKPVFSSGGTLPPTSLFHAWEVNAGLRDAGALLSIS